MKPSPMTLVEVLVIIVVLAFLFLMLLPALPNEKPRPGRIGCVNNLKQIGQAEFAWANDHGDKFSFEVSKTNGGTMEFTTGPNAWRHFQLLSNAFDTPHEWRYSEWLAKPLDTPKVLICPADSDRLRKATTNFARMSNSNLSYFIGLNSMKTNPQGILAGDRNITNGTAIKNGILELATNQPAGWTDEMHKRVGNVLLSDGSVQQVNGNGQLRSTVENTGLFTNRLQMPILGP
jgi:competence protein ComGC